MKKEQMQKLRTKNKEDLAQELKSNQDKLWQLKIDVANGKVKKVSDIKKIKKNNAVISTIIKEIK